MPALLMAAQVLQLNRCLRQLIRLAVAFGFVRGYFRDVMKPNEKSLTPECKSSTCLHCALCKAVNYEEKRPAAPQLVNASKALYGAEASSYYFYFSAQINRHETTRTIRQNAIAFH